MNKERLIPLIVATALFMENMDSTVIATSLPAIATDIGTSPIYAMRESVRTTAGSQRWRSSTQT